MHTRDILLALALGAVVAGCGSSDAREWMKLNQKYTTDDFRRDHRECSKSGKLDEACMRSRGWVDVSATKTEPSRPQETGPLPSTRRTY
jgi:hypothetical protein